MKKMISMAIICLFSLASCAATDQNLESLSSFYDGVWEGYAETSEGRFDIHMEIKNGLMSGMFENTKLKGYIKADNNILFISPFSFMGAQVSLKTSNMSSDRIEGTLIAVSYRDKWFVEKK